VTQATGEQTLTFTVEHERRFAALRHRLRTLGYRLSADCERLLDEPQVVARPAVRDALGQCLLASKRLISLTAAIATADGNAESRLNDGGRDLQQAILSSLNGALTLVAASLDDTLILQDIRSIRDTAKEMLGNSSQSTVASLPAIPVTETESEAVQATYRILVADDDENLRELLERTLKTQGYEVATASDGQEALEMAIQDPPDLVLTDIDMPRLDGVSLLKALKSTEETRHVPVIVVSSQSDLHLVANIIELGAEEHVVKPFQPLLLRARVKATLERKSMRDAERDHLTRVQALTAAAEAVELDAYVPGSLNNVSARPDTLGRLARVFDRMVTGLKSREERLHKRLGKLRTEVANSSTEAAAVTASAEDSPFSIGQVVADRFEIVGVLGKGGMGMVFRARDRDLNEDVAIKVIRSDLVTQDPLVLERLKSEIRLARRISHPNVVRIHDLGEENGTYFITMEFVEGITVAELLDRRGRLTVESTLAIGTQLCEAIAVAHDQQIIHRDIKSANLLVDNNGGLKILDFGIARSIQPDSTRLTRGGLVVGTPHYMAPEQLMGRTVNAQSDIYAVGVVLYECLSGKAPYDGETPLALLTGIMDGSATPLGVIAPDLPPGLAELVHQQLKFDASQRSSSAAELARRLHEIDAST
jgi:CheY-like chemotaxis protein/predicted Ser/Thr protein kinase